MIERLEEKAIQNISKMLRFSKDTYDTMIVFNLDLKLQSFQKSRLKSCFKSTLRDHFRIQKALT